jgi:membrane-bound lytic murein transglycosylase A
LIRRHVLVAATVFLAGCNGVSDKAPVRYQPVSFAELPGWAEADPREALKAFRLSCRSPSIADARAPVPIDAAAFRTALAQACRIAAAAEETDSASARRFFEEHFAPHRVLGPDGPEGLFTGYYEPRLDASRKKRAGFDVPIYGLPPEAKAGAVLAARAEIENGDAGKGWPVLFWAKDPVDVFTLHIQGSGRIVLADGGFARVSYAGNNGHGYVAIGRLMRERNLLPADGTNMPAIQAWLRANSEAGRALMQENPRFIFFREGPDEGGTKGQLGTKLSALASLAVDPAFIPLGLPLWLDTNWPAEKANPMRLLVVAQDTGAAIKGAVRGDMFFGHDRNAAHQAGHMAERGRYFLLLPKVKQGK